MENDPQVGVLLPAVTLRRVVARKSTWEHVDKYVAAAEPLGLGIVLFALNGFSPQRARVCGYAYRRGRWRPWEGPPPPVVLNRLIPATLGSAHLVKLLGKSLQRGLFNSVIPRDRWRVWEELHKAASLRGHLPPTWPLSRDLCADLPDMVEERGRVVVRPGYGATGLRTQFVELGASKAKRYRLRSIDGRSRLVGKYRLIRVLRRRRTRWPCIVQSALPLVTHGGSRCDLRVAVQRNGRGEWCVVGGVMITSRGAVRCEPALKELFSLPRAVWSEVIRLSLDTAEALAFVFPRIADIGIDFGIDRAAKPWILDVTFRDRRLEFLEAGEIHSHAQLYQNPIQYANLLLHQR